MIKSKQRKKRTLAEDRPFQAKANDAAPAGRFHWDGEHVQRQLVGNTQVGLAMAPNIAGDALAHPTLPHVSLVEHRGPQRLLWSS